MKVFLISLAVIAIIIFPLLRLIRRCLDRNVSDLEGISISLEIDGKQSLFILVAAEGLINRLGTLDNQDNELFIGKSDPQIFEAVRSYVTPEMLRVSGGFEHKDRRGAQCQLTVGFKFKDGGEGGFGFRYGSDSQGPPLEVRTLVTEAARLTDPWYENFKEKARTQPRPAPPSE